MQLAKFEHEKRTFVGLIQGDAVRVLREDAGESALSVILDADDCAALVNQLAEESTTELALSGVALLPPIDRQEVWAAGVTYKRSKTARMEESEAAASCYDRVYASPRPELFFKATPHRVSGPESAVRIRADATWNVPEPELALVINRRMELVGYTIGNDMSSRDIEGDNPLYLPQAKVYDQCCGLGPWVTLQHAMPPLAEVGVQLSIERQGSEVFQGQTSLDQLARTPESLIEWLSRDQTFPAGVILLTGTGIVPDSNFTLAPGDQIRIDIDGIGSLTNHVVQASSSEN